MLSLAEIKTGRKIVIDGEPFLVVFNQFSKSGRQGGVMKTKLKNIRSGAVMDKTFQGSDKVDEADISYRAAQFLYQNGDSFEFMDQESFETISLSAEVLGEKSNFLIEGGKVDLQYFEGTPINLQLPIKMKCRIKSTEPGARGDTKTSVQKDAETEMGTTIKVPLFINTGDEIIVNTDTGTYVERAK